MTGPIGPGSLVSIHDRPPSEVVTRRFGVDPIVEQGGATGEADPGTTSSRRLAELAWSSMAVGAEATLAGSAAAACQ